MEKLNAGQKRLEPLTWETLSTKQKEQCSEYVVSQTQIDPTRPHGFGKRDLNFLVRRILFDPLHANHNHGKYNMCSTLMVTKNFVQFVECVFPTDSCDETPTHKWTFHKESVEYEQVLTLKNLFAEVFAVLDSRKELNIMCGKSRRAFDLNKGHMSASKLGWRYDGCAFAEHFNVIFKILNLVLKAINMMCELAFQFHATRAMETEIRNTCDMYKEVLHCLFWDAIFHRRLSELNSKHTLTLREIAVMFLLGVDMIANFNAVGLKVTYNMRWVTF